MSEIRNADGAFLGLALSSRELIACRQSIEAFFPGLNVVRLEYSFSDHGGGSLDITASGPAAVLIEAGLISTSALDRIPRCGQLNLRSGKAYVGSLAKNRLGYRVRLHGEATSAVWNLISRVSFAALWQQVTNRSMP